MDIIHTYSKGGWASINEISEMIADKISGSNVRLKEYVIGLIEDMDSGPERALAFNEYVSLLNKHVEENGIYSCYYKKIINEIDFQLQQKHDRMIDEDLISPCSESCIFSDEDRGIRIANDWRKSINEAAIDNKWHVRDSFYLAPHVQKNSEYLSVCHVKVGEVIKWLDSVLRDSDIVSYMNDSLIETARAHSDFLVIDEHTVNYPCSDHSHKNYAVELAAANDAWEHIFNGGFQLKPGKSIKSIVKEWLAKNYPEIYSDSARERIAAVVIPARFKKGGAPAR